MDSPISLAKKVLEAATKYEEHFTSQGLPPPSFDPSAFPEPDLPDEVIAAREAVLENSTDLQALIRGPRGQAQSLMELPVHLGAMHVVYRYDIVNKIPAEGDISYSALSQACGLNVSDLTRTVRYAIACHLFREPRKGFVAHNSTSKALVHHEELRAWIGVLCEEIAPAASKTYEMMQKWPDSQDMTQTGLQLANGSEGQFFRGMSKDSDRVNRFILTMKALANSPTTGVAALAQAYPWETLGKGGEALLVDMGGSHGDACAALSKRFPKLKFIVQDLPEVNERTRMSSNLNGRLEFMVHDFLTPQPVIADAYFFRLIFHDWSDEVCARILRCLVPAMRPGARVFINDICLPEPGAASAYRNRQMRAFDFNVMVLSRGKERDASQWKMLFQAADERFHFSKIHPIPNSQHSLVEAVWREEYHL